MQDISTEIVEDSEEERPRKKRQPKKVSFADDINGEGHEGSIFQGLDVYTDDPLALDDTDSPRKRPPRRKSNIVTSDDDDDAEPSPPYSTQPKQPGVKVSSMNDGRGGTGPLELAHSAFNRDHHADNDAMLADSPGAKSPLPSADTASSPSTTTNISLPPLSIGKSKGKHVVDEDHPMDAPTPPESAWQGMPRC